MSISEDEYRARLRAAAGALEAMRGELARMERERSEPIAIIGFGCRIPGASNSPEAFWALLENGVDAVTEVPKHRFRPSAPRRDADGAGPDRRGVRWGAFLEDVDRFDPHFFGISPREAASLDPQQRLLLEVTWEALEHAGQVPDRLVGTRTGVFVGLMNDDYKLICAEADPEARDMYIGTGNGHSFPSGRLAYVLGLQGPALTVDTACSSSLVAVHLACRSLRSKESDLALAAGVNLILSPRMTDVTATTGALSPDGRCKTFDAQANGFVRGEGCGVLVLKRLSDAQADGDAVLAVIRGSAVNQDGRSTGLTAPNVRSQQAVIREALQDARVAPSDISYVETHGTGTPLGDPIEVDALAEVLGAPRADGSVCVLGAVKTNIGHLESAAGVAGIIKVVLSMQHEAIPANLHFKRLNPRISLDGTSLVIPTSQRPWTSGERPRFASVNSFGMSGTNAHVVLQDAPRVNAPARPAEELDRAHVLPLSARSPAALEELARSYERFLSDGAAGASACDIAFAASVRRAHHKHRLAVVGRTREELSDALATVLRGEARPLAGAADAGVVFVFSGQGSPWAGMGRELLAKEPVFRQAIERCDDLLRRHVSLSLIDELTASPERSRLAQTEVAQPALFAIQVGLVELWRSWGVAPRAVIGHSVGEVAAAWAAGGLNLEDAIAIVHHRGRLMQEAAGQGRMASVEATVEQVARALVPYGDRLSIAAINDPGSVVLSGESRALEEVMAALTRQGVHGRMLRIDYAFHSPQMDRFRDELTRALAALAPRRAAVPMFSTVDGALLPTDQLGPAYWAKNLRQPVQLAGALDAAIARGYRCFLEVGPHPVLVANIARCLEHHAVRGCVVGSLRREREERRALLTSLADLYAHGHAVDWKALHQAPGRSVPLPSYPWQRERFWVKTTGQGRARPRHTAGAHPLLGARFHVPTQPGAHFWEATLSQDALPYLADHRVQGAVVLPGAAYLEMALAAATDVRDASCTIEDVAFERMLALPEDGAQTIHVVLEEEGADGATLRIFSRPAPCEGATKAGDWTRHATAKLRWTDATSKPLAAEALESIRERCSTTLDGAELYARLAERGLTYGPAFQGVEKLHAAHEDATPVDVLRPGHHADVLGRIRIPESVAGDDGYRLHPAVLDACLHVLAALFPDEGTLVPTAVERMRVHGRIGGTVWAHGRRRDEGLAADVEIRDDHGELVAELGGLRVQRLEQTAPARRAPDPSLHRVAWKRQDLSFTSAPAGTEVGSWLIFCDRGGAGEALAALLRERGERCIQIVPGERYARREPELFEIDPARAEDYGALLRDAFGDGEPCRGVVHLFGLDATPTSETDLTTLAADQEIGCVSVLYLAQALVGDTSREAARLWIVTRGALRVESEDVVSAVSQAPLWGFGRVLALEHPELACTLIDLGPARTTEQASALALELRANAREDQVALRSGGRFVARLVQTSLEEAVAASPSEPRIADGAAIAGDGTYLIAGGLGGIGLSVAEWLVARGARNLVLVGRGQPSARATETVVALQRAGARVEIVRADIAQREQVTALFADIARSMPRLRGIIHSAAVLEDATVLHQTRERFRTAFAPKIDGAWNLHVESLRLPLDFFVLFSSAVTLLGSPGQGNYAAANAFLDALAHARRATGLPATSIGWGPWAEVGLAAAQANRGERLALRGIESMSPDDALATLGRLLERAPAHVGVVPFNVQKWLQFHPSAAGSPLFAELVTEKDERALRSEKASLRQTLRSLPPGPELQARLEAYLVEQAQVVLAYPGRLSTTQSLLELGMDSMMALELSNRIQSELGIRLTASDLLKEPTIRRWAEKAGELLIPRVQPEDTPVAAEAPGHLPLSFAQRNLRFTEPALSNNPAWNLFHGFRITGPLDPTALKRSLDELLARHDALRARITNVDGHPAQEIAPHLALDLPVVDLGDMPEDEREDELSNIALEESRRPFDLAEGPLLRVTLVRFTEQEHVLLVSFHHIVLDLWSIGVFLRELGALYTAFSKSEPSPLAALPARYADFIALEQEAMRGDGLAAQQAFWRDQLAGCPATLELPSGRGDRRVAGRRQGSSKSFALSRALSHAIEELSRREGVTVYVTLLAAFAALLHRTTGQTDLPVMSFSAHRNQRELEGLIGFFTNSLVIRADLSGDPTFEELLARTRGATLNAFAHENLPFELQLESMLSESGLSRPPFASQCYFLFQPFPLPSLKLADLSVELLDISHMDNGAARVDLEWVLWRHPQGLRCFVAYDKSVFDAASIQRLFDTYRSLLESVVARPHERLSVLAAEEARVRGDEGRSSVRSVA